MYVARLFQRFDGGDVLEDVPVQISGVSELGGKEHDVPY